MDGFAATLGRRVIAGCAALGVLILAASLQAEPPTTWRNLQTGEISPVMGLEPIPDDAGPVGNILSSQPRRAGVVAAGGGVGRAGEGLLAGRGKREAALPLKDCRESWGGLRRVAMEETWISSLVTSSGSGLRSE